VTANAIPTDRRKTTTGPSLGFVNHPKISKLFIETAVKISTVEKISQNFPRLLVKTEAQKTAVSKLNDRSHPNGIFGSDKKLLN